MMAVEYVWAGAGTESSAWVRGKVTGTSTRLAVSTSPALTSPVYFGPVAPTTEGIASIEATGLDAKTRYYYALEDDGVLDTAFAGMFRTHPPLGSVASYTIGAAGDAGLPGAGDSSHITNGVSNNPVFDVMREKALAEDWLMFCHLGDMHYRNIASNDHALYRGAYKDVLTFNDTLGADARQGRFFRNVPLAYVWDDHDYAPNNSDRTHVGRQAAAEVYREIVPHYPLPAGPGNAPIYQSWQIGRVLYIAADVRWARDPNTQLDTDLTKTMLGTEQKVWMEQVLRNSSASALVWVMPSIWLSDGGGGDFSSDSWYRFQAERAELTEMLGDFGWADRTIMLQADKHALSIASGPANTWGQWPLFMFASLDSDYSSAPEGQYDIGQSPGRRRYGTLRIEDSGHTIALHGTGYVGTQVWRSYTGYAHVEPHVVSIDYSAQQVFEPFEPIDDDQRLANDVTAGRRDGGEVREEIAEGPLGLETVGRYSASETVNVRDDSDLVDQAGWLLHEGTIDEARYPTIAQELAAPQMEGSRRDIARLDGGDAILINNPPSWLPPGRIAAVVEGYSERIRPREWSIEYSASPASIWEVGEVARPIVLNPNHDFEAGTHGWFAFQGTLTHDRTVSYRGQGCALQTPSGTDTLVRALTTTTDSPRVYAGTEYTFSAWVRTANGRAVDMSVLWRDVDDNQISFPFIFPATAIPAMTWTLITGSAIAPEGAYRVQWNINQRDTVAIPSSELLWIDEAVMTAGTTASPDHPDRADTGGSQLTAAVGTGDTELIVHTRQTPYEGARWITSAGPGETHHHDFPFDATVGGETVRVDACTGLAWDLARTARPADSWGTTDSGLVWTNTTSANTTLSVDTANQFLSLQLTADPSTIRTQLLAPQVADCEVLWSVRTNQTASGASQLPSLLLRYAGVSDFYRSRVHLRTDGRVELSVTRGVTQIGSSVIVDPAVSYVASAALADRLMVRTRVIGHRVLARVWRYGRELEPEHWMIDRTVEDSPIASGRIGFSASTGGGYTGVSPAQRFRLEEVVTPQRMTVQRSVNGISKVHTAGAEISLDRPATVGL
jgi:hypothetical protein